MKRAGKIIICCFIIVIIALIVVENFIFTEVCGEFSFGGGVNGRPKQNFCFKVNKNHSVDYYIGCEKSILDCNNENELNAVYHYKRKIGIYDWIYVKNLFKQIKKSGVGIDDNNYNYYVFYSCKIEDRVYSSTQYEFPVFAWDIKEFEQYNIDVIELCLWAWYNMPEDKKIYFNYIMPFEHMGATDDNYKEYADQLRSELERNILEVKKHNLTIDVDGSN